MGVLGRSIEIYTRLVTRDLFVLVTQSHCNPFVYKALVAFVV